MPDNLVLVGAQWGDEGKGKIVDFLAPHFDVVARFQGGANAGHTVVVEGRKYIFQLLPSAILRPGKTAVIGNGVVVDPLALLAELENVEKAGVEVGDRLRISDRAHLILPYHRSHEVAAEQARGAGKIGTTSKGIGPTYEDKAGRRGLRACDLRDPEGFRRKCLETLQGKNRLASALFPGMELADQSMVEDYLAGASRLVPYLTDVSFFLDDAMSRGQRVLFEGAQGTLLDLDHGTYPFVTSSNATAGGAATGTGVGPARLNRVAGVCKAYATRVGSGPFPTQAAEAESEELRRRGGEYGAVTGRPRRCGWFDVPAARYAARVNSLCALVVTKLDVLDNLAEIPVGIEYLYKGSPLPGFPAEIELLEDLRVRYQTLPGWQEPTRGAKEFAQLPVQAQDYLKFLAERVEVPIAIVSTGPERQQILWMDQAAAALLTGN